MKIRLESENGEFITELDLKDIDVDRMIEYSLLRLQAEHSDVKYKLPLNDNDITELIQYAVVSMLKDEMKREEQNKPVGNKANK